MTGGVSQDDRDVLRPTLNLSRCCQRRRGRDDDCYDNTTTNKNNSNNKNNKKKPLKSAPTTTTTKTKTSKNYPRRKRPRTSSTNNKNNTTKEDDWKLHIPSFRVDPELERLEKEFLGEDYDDDDDDDGVKESPSSSSKLKSSPIPIPNFSMDKRPNFSDDSDDDDDDDFLFQVPTFSKSKSKLSVPKPTTGTGTTSTSTSTGTTTTKETMRLATTTKRKSGEGVNKPKQPPPPPKPSTINKKYGGKLSPVMEEQVEEDEEDEEDHAVDPFESSVPAAEFDYLLPKEDDSLEPEENNEPAVGAKEEESNTESVILSLETSDPNPCKDTAVPILKEGGDDATTTTTTTSTRESQKDRGAIMNVSTTSTLNGDTIVEQFVQPAVPSETTTNSTTSDDYSSSTSMAMTAAPPVLLYDKSNDNETTIPVDPEANKKVEDDKMVLTIAIDHLFCKTETESATVKAFCKALEGNLGTKLGKEAKKQVRSRLVDLINGRIQPTKPSDRATPCSGEEKTAAVSASKEDKNYDDRPPSQPKKSSTESKRQNAIAQSAPLSTESNFEQPEKSSDPVSNKESVVLSLETSDPNPCKDTAVPILKEGGDDATTTTTSTRESQKDRGAIMNVSSTLNGDTIMEQFVQLAVQSETTNNSTTSDYSSSTSMAAPPVSYDKSNDNETTIPVDPEANKNVEDDKMLLTIAIDHLFCKTETENATVKAFCKALEGNLGTKLGKEAKKQVRSRLVDLINGRIQPTKPSDRVTPCSGEKKAAAVSASKEDKNCDHIPPSQPKKSSTEAKLQNAIAQSAPLSTESNFVQPKKSNDPVVPTVKEPTPEKDNDQERRPQIQPKKKMPTESKKRRKSSDQTDPVVIESNLEQAKKSNDSEVVPKVKESHSTAVAEPQSNQDKPTEDDKPAEGNSKPKKTKTKLSKADDSSKTPAEHQTSVDVFDFADTEVSDDEDVSWSKQTAGATEKRSNTKSKKRKNVSNKPADDSRKESNDRELETKKGKTYAKPPRNEQTMGDESDSREVVEVSKPVVDAVPPCRAKRGRPQKSKPQAVSDVSAELEGKTVAKAKAASASARPPPRKRARKGSCALCTTCPCQNLHEHDDHTVFDFKSMSRSDGAVEKALIRRVQKLEKSTENLEEQAEAVRRKLKKHRRDMWKKKEHVIKARNNTFMTESRFLPDAEECEAQQTETQKLDVGVVKQAARKMFANAPGELLLLFFWMYPATRFVMPLTHFLLKEYQPTLTQMLGCRSKKDEESKDNQDSEVGLPEEAKTSDTAEDLISISSEPPAPEDDHGPIEYIKSPETEDTIHRVAWRQGSTADNSIGSQVLRGSSAWGALTTIAEGGNSLSAEDQFCDVGDNDQFGSAWDRLFTDEKEVNDGGMDHLLGLLQTQAGGLSQNPEATQIEAMRASQGTPPVNLSTLSQGRQSLAVEIEGNISSNKQKLAALQKACPNWKENVTYALHQEDEDHVREALDNVRKSRERMAETRRNILEAWERQQVALDVFETALNASLTRIKAPRGVAQPEPVEAEGGYLTAISPDKGHDDICDWEANKDPTTSCIELYVSPTKCSMEKDNASIKSSPTGLDSGLVLSY
jgi:hypothetical protein